MHCLKSFFIALALLTAPAASFAKSDDLTQSHAAKRSDITVGLKGLVCDFCTLALNKTFKRHKAVASTYVDLDNKLLSVELNEGQTLSNTDIIKMVKNAGYTVTNITHKDGREFTPPEKS